MDQDYIGQLSTKEREWLAKFNDEYYGGKFVKGEKHLHKTKGKKREIWRRLNHTRSDVFARAPVDYEEPVIAHEMYPRPPTPAYLDTPQYRQLLQEYRDALDANDRKAIKAAADRLRRAFPQTENRGDEGE